MAYVDGFLLPIPKKNLGAYKKMSLNVEAPSEEELTLPPPPPPQGAEALAMADE